MATSYASNKKINALDSASTPLGPNDELVISQNGDTFRTPLSAVEAKVFDGVAKANLTTPAGTEVVIARQTDGTLRQVALGDIVPTGSITDAKVTSDTNARISGNKILPNFGSQNITTSGSVFLNQTTPITGPNSIVRGVQTANQNGVQLGNYTNTDSSETLTFTKSRGSVSSPFTIAQNNDFLGSVLFAGGDGTKFVPAAEIVAFVNGTPGANDMPGALSFRTTADGAASTTERMRITPAGNVGIGTLTPASALDVHGTVTATAFVGSQNVTATGTIRSNGSGGSFAQINGATADGANLQLNRGGSASQNAYITQFQGSLLIKNLDSGAIVFTNTTSDTERMRIDASGNVGIGTSSPACLLDCSQTNAGSGTEIRAGNPDTGASSSASVRCIQGSVSATITSVGNAASYWGNLSNHPMIFFTNNAERMRVTADGNVGIGTGVPRGRIDVAAGTIAGVGNMHGNANNSGFSIWGGESTLDGGYIQFLGSSFAGAANSLIFGTNGAERMRINASGDVSMPGNVTTGTLTCGFGSRQVADYADFRFLTSNNRGWRMGTGSNGTNLGIFFIQASTDDFVSSFIDGITIDTNGRVGIGTSSPTQELSVAGDITATAGISAGTSLYAQNYVYIGGVQVIGARKTGWSAPVGTISRAALIASATPSYSQSNFEAVIQALKAVITDLRAHGLIGN